MNILIIGAGGREHAFAWKVSQSPQVKQIYVAPGNAGTVQEPKVQNVAISATDIPALIAFAKAQPIHLCIVGPEAPLVAGIVDAFSQANLRCFGPTKAAARLEGSKSFSKDFLQRHEIPTAEYQSFTEIGPALAYIKTKNLPIVIKADGLAAGKGVIIAQSLAEAEIAVQNMLDEHSFGDAGQQIVIEEFLEGEEVSFIVMVDGKHILPLATSQDHKAVGDNDTGPNTGGMGAYSPAPIVTPKLHNKIMQHIIEPTVKGLVADGHPYTGFLYAGLMIDHTGQPQVLEYNCRCGDPETQPIMMRLQSDLVTLCNAALDKKLDQVQANWDQRAALGIVLAAKGYPGQYQMGDTIQGLAIQNDKLSKIFHAGTLQQGHEIITQGGRVLCATALGETIHDAQQNAYTLAKQVDWPGRFFRTDIGYRAIAHKQIALDNSKVKTVVDH